MQRVKNFNSTGLDPNGKLYAGDLNAIEDACAALVDYAQTIGASVYAIGDASIQMLKYGASEARLTAAFRVDGLLRALGGLVPPAFTTPQRDAIPAGYAPYSVIIMNTMTNRLEQNIGTDGARNWQPVAPNAPSGASVADGVEALRAIGWGASLALGQPQVATFLPADIYANRPGAPATNGVEFSATDTLGKWRSQGGVWVLVAQSAPRISVTEFSLLGTGGHIGGPYDRQEVVLQVDASTEWRLKYDSAEATVYKWKLVGGVQFETGPFAFAASAPEGTWHLASATQLAIPRAGIYLVDLFTSGVNVYQSMTVFVTPAQSVPGSDPTFYIWHKGGSAQTSGITVDSGTAHGAALKQKMTLITGDLGVYARGHPDNQFGNYGGGTASMGTIPHKLRHDA